MAEIPVRYASDSKREETVTVPDDVVKELRKLHDLFDCQFIIHGDLHITVYDDYWE